jgi:hypothetical protein
VPPLQLLQYAANMTVRGVSGEGEGGGWSWMGQVSSRSKGSLGGGNSIMQVGGDH